MFRKHSRTMALLCGFMALAVCISPTWADDAKPVPKIAHFHLDGPLLERPQPDFGFSMGAQPDTLKNVIERFEKAKDDDEIRAIIITFGSPSIGMAQLQELRQAMKDVGKPVYVHADQVSTGLYALSSAATNLSITPTGDVWLLGFHVEAPYLKGLLDMLNIEADFEHIGDFKSAGETLYRTGPSEDAEANMNWLLDGLYDSLTKMIADSRFHGDVPKVKKIVDGAPYNAEKALKLGLIDAVQHRQELIAGLKAKYGDDLKFVKNYGGKEGPDVDFANPFAFFQIISDLMTGEEESTGPSIAVVYVDGNIVTGDEKQSPFGGSSGAHSNPISKALDKATEDDNVKAVVLRVDSPGGSALASEVIYEATQRVRAAGKPLVVSMGNVAASGGYYVSCGSDWIIADPATITASIGVVGGKLVTTGMWNSIGVNWHEYKRGESSDIMSSARKWDDDQRKRLHDWMTDVYEVFKGHIVEHRGKKLVKPIDDMAGGRVYTGAQALKLGLVDDLGSFSDAVAKAADLANLADYDLRILPKPKNFFDIIRESLDGSEEDSVRVSANNIFAADSPMFQAVMPMLNRLDPQRAKVIFQSLQRLQMIHEESVILMTPNDFVITDR